MGIKRKITALRLDKIAVVDTPCQEHATIALVKRAPKGPEAIIKASFQQALTGCLLADQVREAFYTAFDNMWEGKDAFRTALIDELSAGGDGSTASTDYKAWLTGLVDRAVLAAKAAGAATISSADLNKAFTQAATDWLSAQETTMAISNKAQLSAAITKYQTEGAKPDAIAEIRKAAKDLGETSLLPAELADAAPQVDVAAIQRENTVLKMAPAIRKHFEGLAADAQTSFLAKSADAQQAEVDAANAGDPVVYTCKDGTEVRKSAGALMAKMARDNDALRGEIVTLKTEGATASIEKRALAYPNLAKSVVSAQLGVIDAMPDGEPKTAALASLTAMNKAAGGIFKSAGSTGSALSEATGSDAESPTGRMDTIAKRIAGEQKVSIEKAHTLAITDPDYQRAYKDSLDGIPAVAAAS